MLRALWVHREFVWSLVRRELQARSARALGGYAWLVVQPAIQILIYTVIFSEVLRAKLPGSQDRTAYALYLCAGLLPWAQFSEIVLRAQTLFLENADLLRTVRLPRVTLPAALVLSSGINLAIVLGLFLLVLVGLGRWPGIVVWTLLPLIAIQSLLAIGLGVLSGSLNVFFRDVGEAVPLLLQFWFWLTPIVYPLSIVPEPFRSWMHWNPLFPIYSGYQNVVVLGSEPSWPAVGVVAGGAVFLALAAWGTFRALSTDLIDEL